MVICLKIILLHILPLPSHSHEYFSPLLVSVTEVHPLDIV